MFNFDSDQWKNLLIPNQQDLYHHCCTGWYSRYWLFCRFCVWLLQINYNKPSLILRGLATSELKLFKLWQRNLSGYFCAGIIHRSNQLPHCDAIGFRCHFHCDFAMRIRNKFIIHVSPYGNYLHIKIFMLINMVFNDTISSSWISSRHSITCRTSELNVGPSQGILNVILRAFPRHSLNQYSALSIVPKLPNAFHVFEVLCDLLFYTLSLPAEGTTVFSLIVPYAYYIRSI